MSERTDESNLRRRTHTFGLGGSSLVLWVVLASTGMLMLRVAFGMLRGG